MAALQMCKSGHNSAVVYIITILCGIFNQIMLLTDNLIVTMLFKRWDKWDFHSFVHTANCFPSLAF